MAYYVKIAELYVSMNNPEGAHPYIESAIERYQLLLDDDPSNVGFLRRQANAYAMMNRHQTAVDVLTAAIDEADGPNQAQLKTGLSRIYLAQAMTVAEPAKTDITAQKKFLDYVILAYETDAENDAAKTSLTRFGFSSYAEAPRAREAYDPRDDPENASDEALSVVGTHELLRGDKQLGIRMLELSIQKNPRNHEAMNNLAFTILESDSERALELVSRAIHVRPRPEYFDTRGHVYMQLENWKEAVPDLKKSVANRPNVKVFEKIAECYEQRGMESFAETFRKKADRLRNKNKER